MNITHINFGQQVIDIYKDLGDILKQYFKTYRLKENDDLFGLSTGINKDNQVIVLLLV